MNSHSLCESLFQEEMTCAIILCFDKGTLVTVVCILYLGIQLLSILLFKEFSPIWIPYFLVQKCLYTPIFK